YLPGCFTSKARVWRRHLKDSPLLSSSTVQFRPSLEPFSTQLFGSSAGDPSPDVKVYILTFSGPSANRQFNRGEAVSKVTRVSEELSNNSLASPPPSERSVKSLIGRGNRDDPSVAGSVIDGGRASSPVPHLEGLGPISKSSVAPRMRSKWERVVLLYSTPFSLTLWMYLFLSLTFGALMTILLPFSRWMVIFLK